MIYHVITLFPEIIRTYVSCGVLGKAVEKGIIEVRLIQLRDFSTDRHRTVDDYPHGGGAGMILKSEPVFRAVEHAREKLRYPGEDVPVILTTPRGEPFTAGTAKEMAQSKEMIIICGHYGGVDERVHQRLATREVSAGDFVLSGGEAAALMLIDAVSRFIPGVVGREESVQQDSFEQSLLGAPAYTRPPDFRGMKTPDVLLSGNHREIEKWRREQRLKKTFEKRPGLLKDADLSAADIDFLNSIGYSHEE